MFSISKVEVRYWLLLEVLPSISQLPMDHLTSYYFCSLSIDTKRIGPNSLNIVKRIILMDLHTFSISKVKVI